jgi:M6 family metalloprotease-like protein
MITELARTEGAAAAVPDADRGVLWVVETAPPALVSVDLASGDRRRHTDLPAAPAGLALSGDRSLLLVTSRDGTVAVVDAGDPSSGPTPLAATPADTLGQAAATRPPSGPGSALAVSLTRGGVLAVSLSDGVVRTVLALPGTTGVTTSGSRVFAAATVAGAGRVVRVNGGAAQALAAGVLPTGHLTAAADASALLVAHPAAGRVSVVSLVDGSVTTGATDDVPGALVEAHLLDDGRVLVVTSTTVAVADYLGDLPPRPRLVPPADPLFVGSWVRLQYDLSGSGLTPDDVGFVVTDGPDVAIVSHTRTVTGTGGERETLLVAGGLLGRFALQMVEAASGAVLDEVEFEVTDHWRNPDVGPSMFVQGDTAPPSPGYDWGGGPNSPQNLGTLPHNGRWRVGVLLVDTSDGRYPTDAAGLAAVRKAVLDEVQDGVAVDGTTRSARHYYEEVSRYDATTNRGLTVRAHDNRVFGPVSLPDGWGSYFAQKKDADGTVTDERWSSLGATVQTIVTRAHTDGVMSTSDFSAIDVLLLVPRSPDTTAGTSTKRFVWPHASSTQTFLAGSNVQTDQRSFGWIFVPPDFNVHDGRRVHATLSHEIGHTLGLPDLYGFPSYTPDITSRLTMDWDMMAGSRNVMPHYSLSNRMRQGWVSAAHLRLFNFAVSGSVNQDVTLSAAGLAPTAGRFRGIEIRLSDGWNTYVEYRAKQPSHLGDTLPDDRRVVITDVTSEIFRTPVERPPIVFVHNDADGDGPILPATADYEDVDPTSQKSLVVTVRSTAADSAVVNVKYGSDGRPDPGIRPWGGPPEWKSPDIEVRNARAQADPGRWANTPWLGNDNTVVAKVRNNGDLLCKGVVVDLFAIRFTTGDESPMLLLGTVTKDIPAGQTVEFSAPWHPPETEDPHFCLVARIRLYQDPTIAGLFETNIFNNEARSNYFRFVSASSSPSNRVSADVRLSNPFSEPTVVHAVVRSGHPYHRVFVEHRWHTVPARSSRPVRVMDEALVGFPEEDEYGSGVRSDLWKTDNTVGVEGWAERPFESDCGARTLTGGAAIRVGAGRATVVEILEATTSFVRGRVYLAEDGDPVTDGSVVAVAREEDEFGGHLTTEAQVQNDGEWVTEWSGSLPGARQTAVAEFLGAFGAAPSRSERVPLET